MQVSFVVADGRSLEFELPVGVELAHCRAPRGAPLADPLQAAAQALRQPLGFPPLAQAAVPGDRVALALDVGLPQAPALVAAVVREMMGRGVLPEDIVVLRTPDDAVAGAPDPRSGLPAELAGRVVLQEHRADDKDHLAYLATDERSRPVYLNRHLADADLVVPMGCVRLKPAAGCYGLAGAIYPAFSDAPTQARIRGLPSEAPTEEGAEDIAPQQEAQQAVDRVVWLLGVQF
jgi:hypothetical protein